MWGDIVIMITVCIYPDDGSDDGHGLSSEHDHDACNDAVVMMTMMMKKIVLVVLGAE